jgi:COG (conserved oligomeric Golgi) complex component, COG2
MAGDNGVDNQFIFREIEFEDENFHAASFVAKYRRVTSLESLRDQLRLYCDALKQQLYGIINRDYKDFITIATKVCCKTMNMFYRQLNS